MEFENVHTVPEHHRTCPLLLLNNRLDSMMARYECGCYPTASECTDRFGNWWPNIESCAEVILCRLVRFHEYCRCIWRLVCRSCARMAMPTPPSPINHVLEPTYQSNREPSNSGIEHLSHWANEERPNIISLRIIFLTIKALTVKIESFHHDCGRRNQVVLDLAGSLALDSTVANYTDWCSSRIQICNKQCTVQRSSLSVPFCWCAVVTVHYYGSAVYVMEQKKQLNRLRKTVSQIFRIEFTEISHNLAGNAAILINLSHALRGYCIKSDSIWTEWRLSRSFAAENATTNECGERTAHTHFKL